MDEISAWRYIIVYMLNIPVMLTDYEFEANSQWQNINAQFTYVWFYVIALTIAVNIFVLILSILSTLVHFLSDSLSSSVSAFNYSILLPIQLSTLTWAEYLSKSISSTKFA